ncbi:ABC transporter permease [Ancylobacter oerskovii]|uniref:ABC transporter permease n=1 Tax=Ancylobacter oerskovii TaxID=459519 RepID=A0ABW4YZS6_9HYPH|nr:ABC transporter permease [Ancylobacter oerskovii]MBS7543881.1 ABC transporter permease [Ancylobacter oerskovii]
MSLASSDARIEPGTDTRPPAGSFEEAFRAEHRRRRRHAAMWRLVLNAAGIALFVIAWELIPRYSSWINEVLFPPPSQVFEAFVPLLLSGEIVKNIRVSLLRAASGFGVALVLGIGAGVMTARLSWLQYLFEPLLHGFRSIPAIALIPLCILWFGIGETSKTALIAWGAFFPLWITTFIGVRDVNPIYLRSAACLGAGRLTTLFLVVLPAALPFILAGIRQALSVSLVVLVAAEMSGASSGIAHMMSEGHQLFRVDIMFIGLAVLGAFGFLVDRTFVAVARRLFPWYQITS